jgi:23S rRNA (cytidine2498-2'-O)-methyltransferase
MILPTNKPIRAIYIAKPDYLHELCTELGSVEVVIDQLVFSSIIKMDCCFALDVWLDPHIVTIQSISEAATLLRHAGKYWYLHPLSHVRRSRLIEEKLIRLPSLTRDFPIDKPIPNIGCFTLLDNNTLVYATKRSKRWPMGNCYFNEDKQHPPNRAYLKLWEALTLLERLPQVGDVAFDLGASPGGWTYVLQSLGAHVTAVDKAPLDPHIAALPNVKFLQQSAFALNPEEYSNHIQWLVCDVACYPDRLYEFIQKWLPVKGLQQMIFTIKLQGSTDHEVIKRFQSIPNSETLHLYHNKHEATFFCPAPRPLVTLDDN